MNAPIPSIDLFNKVKGGFVAQGTTLTGWCRDNGSHLANARICLIGSWDGPKAREFRKILCREAGLSIKSAANAPARRTRNAA